MPNNPTPPPSENATRPQTLTLRGVRPASVRKPSAQKTKRSATTTWMPPPDPPADHFWFVWNPARSKPKRRHATVDTARAEATRLGAVYPAEQFHVYECRLCDEQPTLAAP